MSDIGLKTENNRTPSRDEKGRFLPGAQAPAGVGRPKGSRTMLSEAFYKDLANLWQEQGGDILERVAKDDPATVLRVISALMPKEFVGRFEIGAGEKGPVISFVGASHPLIPESGERDVTPGQSDD